MIKKSIKKSIDDKKCIIYNQIIRYVLYQKQGVRTCAKTVDRRAL